MKNKLLYIVLVALIVSISLNVIFLSGYIDKEKNTELDKRYEQAKLNNHVLDLIEDRPFTVKFDFYPTLNMSEFRDFAQNHGLKPVIYFGNNFGNKSEIDAQLIKKYNLREGDYITDVKQQMEPFLQKYENESWIMGHYSVVIEDEKEIIYEEINTATSSNLTKSKIKELLKDNRVYNMEIGTTAYEPIHIRGTVYSAPLRP